MEPQHQPIRPVKLKTTAHSWTDLPAYAKIADKVKPLQQWLQAQKDQPVPGHPVLFEGTDEEAKKLTAGLLASEAGREVYRVDLSQIVSKYIAETEKNLDRIFEKAASENWILFFDEADALFGKRTSIRDAHDKYANQAVSYLLQRIEAHKGLVIVAAKGKSNIDTAFLRRFQTVVHFPPV
jgi:SpoVK/Ycf46/Vps4 family AAA+-type ATPase